MVGGCAIHVCTARGVRVCVNVGHPDAVHLESRPKCAAGARGGEVPVVRGTPIGDGLKVIFVQPERARLTVDGVVKLSKPACCPRYIMQMLAFSSV